VGGELPLPSTPFLPAEPGVNMQVQNWHSRSDVPAAMTGAWELFLTVDGRAGFLRLALRLDNVTRTSSQAGQALPPAGLTFRDRLRRRIATTR
jgi:hypothetical protein